MEQNQERYFIHFTFMKGKIEPQQGFENMIFEDFPLDTTEDLRSLEALLVAKLKVDAVKIMAISII